MKSVENDHKIKLNKELKEAMTGNCHCLAIRKKARQITRLYDDKLSEYGLTVTQFGIMTTILVKKEISVQELADFLDLNQSALSRGLNPLVRDGLLLSHADKDDARKRILMLTETGKQKINSAAIGWKAAQEESEKII